MEQTVINLTTYETGGNQSHNLRKRWSSITQLMERVVINHTTYGMGGNPSHNL